MTFKKNILNLASLTSIQLSNAILPLVIFPYVLSVVGERYYSNLVISEAIMLIAHTFVLYSFEVNGVPEIVKAKDNCDKEQLSKLLIVFLSSRLLIWLTIVFIILIFSIAFDTEIFWMLFFWMLYPLGFTFQSSYFFQALERNGFLALIVLFSRFLAGILIFLFIRNPGDAHLVPILIGSSYTAGGITAFIFAWFSFDLGSVNISFSEIKQAFRNGKEIFFGRISVLLFRNSNVLLLQLLTGNSTYISTYSLAEKYINGIQSSIRPINQLFYPKTIRRIKNFCTPNFPSFFAIAKHAIFQLLLVGIAFTTLPIIIFNFAPLQTAFGFLFKSPETYTLFKIMIPSVAIGILNFMFGTVGLNFLNKQKYLATVIFFSGVISISISIILIMLLSSTGASISFVIGESLLFVLVLKKYIKKPQRNKKQ